MFSRSSKFCPEIVTCPKELFSIFTKLMILIKSNIHETSRTKFYIFLLHNAINSFTNSWFYQSWDQKKNGYIFVAHPVFPACNNLGIISHQAWTYIQNISPCTKGEKKWFVAIVKNHLELIQNPRAKWKHTCGLTARGNRRDSLECNNHTAPYAQCSNLGSNPNQNKLVTESCEWTLRTWRTCTSQHLNWNRNSNNYSSSSSTFALRWWCMLQSASVMVQVTIHHWPQAFTYESGDKVGIMRCLL